VGKKPKKTKSKLDILWEKTEKEKIKNRHFVEKNIPKIQNQK
jgi:hypothetical protein